MGLKERIQADMQKAAKERNSLALSALRMALAAIKNKEIEERGEIGEDSILKVLATMVKQRKESIDLFRRRGRDAPTERPPTRSFGACLPGSRHGKKVVPWRLPRRGFFSDQEERGRAVPWEVVSRSARCAG